MRPTSFFDSAGKTCQQTRMFHWDAIARQRDSWQGLGAWYYRHLQEIYHFHIHPNQNILEVGCAEGNLLAALQPARGVDFSGEMICRARKGYPELEFIHADAHDLSEISEKFDIIILSDLVNDLWDVQRVFDQVRRLCSPHTRLIMNIYSHLSETPLSAAQKLNLATQNPDQNWLTRDDLRVMFRLAGFEAVRISQEVLWLLPLGAFANRFVVRFWPFHEMALSNFVIAHPVPERAQEPLVSVIVPACNESGNIKAVFERTPQMGHGTELIFVEGHSKDDTYAAIEREIAAHPSTPSLLLRQTGIGKADAVPWVFPKQVVMY